MTIDQFTKSSAPITLLVNIANPVAIKLAKILLEQGSRLLIIDKLTPGKRKLLGDLLNRSDCLFMDSASTFKNIEKFKKIDYIYYFLSQLTVGSTYPEIFPESMEILKMDHKEFIRESNRLDAYMKLSVSFDSAFTMITSGYVSQFLEAIPEANLQIQKYAESLVLEYVERNNANARIVRIGELIGRDADIASPTYVARLIREVIIRSKINVFGDGMQQNFLVHTEDAVYAILKAAFAPEAKGRTFLAAYSHPFTSLSIAYQLLELTADEKQVIFNEVLPDHEKVTKWKDMCLAQSVAGLGWEPQIRLEQALSETVTAMAKHLNQPWSQVGGEVNTEEEAKEVKSNTKQSNVSLGNVDGIAYTMYQKFISQPLLGLLSFTKPTKKKQTPAKKERSFKNTLTVIVAVLVFVLATPYIHFAITSYKIYSITKQIKEDVASLDSQNFPRYAVELPPLVDGLTKDYKAVSYLKNIPTIGTWYSASSDLLYGARSLANSASVALEAVGPALNIAKGFSVVSPNNPAGTVSRDYFTEIGQIMSKESFITQSVQDAKIGNARLQRVNVNTFPASFRNNLYKAKVLASTYTTAIDELAKTYDLIPYLLGYKERRTYFVMIQNETEIRATGGWFTNYAVLGIENGQVRQLVVNDIYNLDGLITGLPAPTDMQQGLGLKTIKSSLSNWSPEMAETSKQLTTLLAQGGLYKSNDVTIAITFQVVRDVLNVLGGITVEGLGEVTASNLYEKVGVLHSQFVPGSQEKTKVVSIFMPKFLDAIAGASAEKKQEVLQVLAKSITQRSIMIYTDNVEVRSRILDTYSTYRTLDAIEHPLFAVDWNWGGNKANRFIKRSVDVIINEATKKATMTMLYTNESKSDNYPEGKYVNVQRIYYPEEFVYAQATGFSGKLVMYKTAKNVPYLLAEMQILKQETKPITVEFNINSIPTKLSLYKQSGYEPEVVRVIITRAQNSVISEAKLREQEYTQVDDKWVKTYVRKEDITVHLAN